MKHQNKEDCQKLLASISDYVDGSLQGELCRSLEQHMAGCDDCQVVVDTLRKTIELYKVQNREDVPHEIRQRLFKRLELEDLLPGGTGK